MQEELYIKKEFAEIKQLKNNQNPNENVVRVYCTQYNPDGKDGSFFNFQIRTHKPINQFGQGKARDMIATVGFSVSEMKQILGFMEKYRH